MKKLLAKIRKLLRDRRTRQIITRFVSITAAVVVFVTTYALVLPAITMESEAYCGIPAHQHSDDCYELQLVCEIPESPGHHHSDACYSVNQVLVCETEEHEHSVDNGCYDDEGNLTCTKAEHTHNADDNCYEEERVLICEEEESEGHQHTNDCYEKVLTCGLEVHTHSTECYVNPDSGATTEAAVEASTGASTGAAAASTGVSSTGATEDGSVEYDFEEGSEATGNGDNSNTGATDASENATTALTTVENATAGVTADGHYVPQLDPVNFSTMLDSHTGIYYHSVADGEVVEDSTSIPADGWNRVDNHTELGVNDLLRVYLSYSIPAGSLNPTNPVARYRLPANLHLTDAQVNAINSNVNGIAGQYVDMDTLEILDVDKYYAYLGVEAVEGDRRPDEDPEEYLADVARRTGNEAAEYISALVRVEDVFDEHSGEYEGTDLVVTFTPYSIEKNQHEYDSDGQPTKAGQEIQGWLTLDFNLSQVDWDETSVDTFERETEVAVDGAAVDEQPVEDQTDEQTVEDNSDDQAVDETGSTAVAVETVEHREQTADIVFVEEGRDEENHKIDEISTKLTVVDEAVVDVHTVDNQPAVDDATVEDQGESDGEGATEETAAAATEEAAVEDTSDESTIDETSALAEKDKTDTAENAESVVIMPAMSFNDKITVRTGKPAGIDDNAGGTVANAADSLPEEAEVTVRVEADEGTFPAGTTMVLKAVDQKTLDGLADTLAETVESTSAVDSSEDKQETAEDSENEKPEEQQSENTAEEQKNIKTYGFQAVDITFIDAEGNEVEPAKPVRVALTSETVEQARKDAENSSVIDPVVVHVDDEGNTEQMDLVAPEEIEPAQGRSEEEIEREMEAAKAADTADTASTADAAETDSAVDNDAAVNDDAASDTTVDNDIDTTDTDTTDDAAQSNTGEDAEPMEGETNAEATDAEAESSTVGFTTDSFSVYAIVYTVDFEYEVDGKMYQFSLPGGGFVSFTDLVEVLGIIGDTNSEVNEAEIDAADVQDANGLLDVEASEAAKKFVADVESVEFSSPELVDVSKVETDTTVGQIKESRNLEREYSAELTEEQIEGINAQTVEAGDWALISMLPFVSEETLTVTMRGGEVFIIRVTDAQIKKDFITASGEIYEITVTYDEYAQIPDDATLKITEFSEGSDEFEAAREYIIEKKLSEDPGFDGDTLGLSAFDLSILDKDGNQVEPKAAVNVSLTMKHLPEEIVEADAQDSIEIHHLDESSGDVAVETVASAFDGSIRVEEETAQAEFQLESFSTFTVNWSANVNQSNTTLRWQYYYWNWGQQQTGTRDFVNVNYVDENGNAINRPDSIGWTIDYNLGDNGEMPVNIADVLGKEISGRTFERAYIIRDGNQADVATVVGGRDGQWNYNYVVYYDQNNNEVYRSGNWQENRYQGETLYLEYSGGPHTTIHYGYMEGDTFVEFDEQPSPTNTSTSFGWAHLIYDFAGTDDQGLHVDWKYSGTYYHTSETTNPEQGGTAMQPILRYYNNAWRYYNGNISSQNDTRNNSNWKAVADGSDIYVVYEKPVIPMGGTPSPSENSPQPDTPYILKESVSNTDGTNTLSLSVTGSRKPMITEKVADVIVILDLSSSMRRDIGSQTAYDSNYQTVTNSRYYQAKNAVQKLADRLYAVNGTDGEQYRMGLITFSNYAGRTYLSPTENQSTFQSTLDGITAYEGSGTNWEHALQLANQMSVASDRATYIVFITDGEPSVRQTRGNLTNEQLSGVNNTSNPAAEGDIFHGGLNNGRFFDNTWDKTTPDFRDYFGSATFGGLMNNAVWDARNRNAAVDEVASMLGHNKGFYAIGVSSEVNYLGDFAAAAGVDANHYKLVTSATAFDEVIDDILEELDINGVSGQANIKMFDGITDLTQTISKVNQTEDNRLLGVDGDFKYYKSTAPADWSTWTTAQKAAYALGVEYANSSETPTEYASYTSEEIDAYNLGKDISFTEWTTRAEDGCAAAVYNTETGAVEWNMGQKFMLEDGVTYKVSFICWPSQEAYDIIAKLNNGTITFGDTDLYPQEIWDQFEGDLTNGYTLKTNAEGANTKYSKATDVNGNVTVGDEQDPLPFQHVPPMPLDKDKLNVAKTWQASRIDSQTPESVILQVVGDDELYKQFEITPTETVDGSDTPNKGRSENIYISCGHLKVNKDTGEVVIYESGHDFTLREIGENSRHWDLDASICRPMKINMEETMLVLVEEDDVPNAMKTNVNLAYLAESGNEYYRVDGNVYKVDEALTDITGFNTRRSFLDLSKEVLVDNEVWPETVDEVFTYKIKFNIDPTTLSWDPDLEKYIIISTRNANGTVLPSSILALTDAEYTPTAKLPSECGFEESNNTRYLVAENDVEFYLSIKNGWSVRFLNLPAGTTYSIEEVLPEDFNYDFNTVRLETRKDSSSATPVSTDTYTTIKMDGSIEETSTLYKVVYRNAAKTKEVQILKTGQDASTPLGGAKFDLYTEKAYTSNPQGTPFKTDLVSSNEAATKGKIDLGELPIGKYYLVETKAPDGYNMRTEPVIITVSKTSVTYDDGTTLSQSGSGISQIGDVYQLKVTNDEGVALPNTGGPGTKLFTILGSILILGAGVLLWRRRRLI